MKLTKEFVEENGFIKTMQILEFKVLRLVLDKELSLSQNAIKLGIHRNSLNKIIKGYGIRNTKTFYHMWCRKKKSKVS